MGVVDAYIMSAGISGDAKGTSADKIQTSHQVRYFVKCDSSSDTAPTIIEHFRRTAGLPFIGDTYAAGNDTDSEATCRSIQPKLIDKSGGLFHVDVIYEPKEGPDSKEEKPDKGDPSKTTDNPLDWLDEISTSSMNRSLAVWKGTYRGTSPEGIVNEDLPIDSERVPCNSAGFPFVPGLEMDVAISVIRITKRASAYYPNEDEWVNTVNSEAFTITKSFYSFQRTFKPHKVKIASYTQDFQMTNNYPHWRQTVELHVNPLPHGWREEVPDRGHVMLRKSGARLPNGTTLSFVAPDEVVAMEITGPAGETLSEASPLDGMGGLADPKADQVYLIWQKYREKSFAGIIWF